MAAEMAMGFRATPGISLTALAISREMIFDKKWFRSRSRGISTTITAISALTTALRGQYAKFTGERNADDYATFSP